MSTNIEIMNTAKKSGHHASPSNSTGKPVAYGFAPGRFDMDRMKEAIASPSIMAPSGMTRDEIIKFITSHAK